MTAKNKAKLFFLTSITVFSFATLLLTIVNYNPFSSEVSVFIVFYLALFLSLSGLITLILLLIKSRFLERDVMTNLFVPTLRQSSLLSLILSLLLALKGLKVLDLWVSIPLIIAIFMVELYSRGITKSNKHAS